MAGGLAPPLALAILAADAWVRELSLPWQLGSGLAIQLAAGYWAIAEVLRRRLNSKGMFADRRGLINWVTIVVIGTLLNSLIFIAGLT
jgi:two-component system sensor kinase FixL